MRHPTLHISTWIRTRIQTFGGSDAIHYTIEINLRVHIDTPKADRPDSNRYIPVPQTGALPLSNGRHNLLVVSCQLSVVSTAWTGIFFTAHCLLSTAHDFFKSGRQGIRTPISFSEALISSEARQTVSGYLPYIYRFN